METGLGNKIQSPTNASILDKLKLRHIADERQKARNQLWIERGLIESGISFVGKDQLVTAFGDLELEVKFKLSLLGYEHGLIGAGRSACPSPMRSLEYWAWNEGYSHGMLSRSRFLYEACFGDYAADIAAQKVVELLAAEGVISRGAFDGVQAIQVLDTMSDNFFAEEYCEERSQDHGSFDDIDKDLIEILYIVLERKRCEDSDNSPSG